MKVDDADALRARVLELEVQLQVTKALLRGIETPGSTSTADVLRENGGSVPLSLPVTLPIGHSTHNLMLLSDSALPLGSFAYSSGLESFLAHHKHLPPTPGQTNLSLFHKFLKLSIQSMAYTSVPYVVAAFRDPLALVDLDNDLDASTPCNVARRASIAQGRALLSVWEKAFAPAVKVQRGEEGEGLEAATALEVFVRDLKLSALSPAALSNNNMHQIPVVNGHLAPLWGAICLSLGLNLEESGYLFLLNHSKAVISAGVRASVMGPYMAQNVLASKELQELLSGCLEKVWLMRPEEAGQVVPSMDLWMGRHELLYSRIFNS
ncbi:uncharacterized protein Z519_09009 [Cladophialophora bantiana CBS 173.52]|uniref:Urease accessory protein UreF n=1 Tax=Cladophialophora bantiana (strain ATCC 10958 / CBS 173.52 / CDC B-1940 / NIH 8579) TaxID=1442370 RepID=A0A0D2I0H7_CLAB1|nr:uncharacterized protein Z519_09009 [Cladophialophora bantiana CBS 173.52]KIW90364.1 hypothetical protein Z519_09009 [Cladophialophora bantiana CBS 173.52]